MNEYLHNALETAKKELQSNRQLPGHARRALTRSVASVLSSPSQQWKIGGAMISPDK
jgi:hypothetical protein